MAAPEPPYTADRFSRCVAKCIQWRAAELRAPGPLVAALVAYWWREARKAERS